MADNPLTIAEYAAANPHNPGYMRSFKLILKGQLKDPGKIALGVLWHGKSKSVRNVAAAWLVKNGFGWMPATAEEEAQK